LAGPGPARASMGIDRLTCVDVVPGIDVGGTRIKAVLVDAGAARRLRDRGARHALFLPIGTGIAGALMIGGHILVADGWSGELGHLVVVGGGLAGSGPTLLGPLRVGVDGAMTVQRRPRIVPAGLGERAGSLGAALLAAELLAR